MFTEGANHLMMRVVMAVYGDNLNPELQGSAAREPARDAEVQMNWKAASRCLLDLWRSEFTSHTLTDAVEQSDGQAP